MRSRGSAYGRSWHILSVNSLAVAIVALPACAQERVTAQPVARSVETPAPVQPEPPKAVPDSSDQRVAEANTPAKVDAPAPAPAQAGESNADPVLARGQRLFAKHCAICHGETGDGAGKFAYLMNPRPRNFQAGKFKLATTQNQIPTDDDLQRTISRGMPGSAMPPWGHLPLADLQALVKYLRQIHIEAEKKEIQQGIAEGSYEADEAEPLLKQRTQPGPPLMVPPEPSFDNLRWFRGRSVYLEACASCHGADGHPVAEAVKFDEEGYPVPPRSFVNGVFKGGSEGHQLYARILKGMRGTPMPAYEGTYSPDVTWDLIHYVQSLSRAGAQQRAQLRQGSIVAPYTEGALPEGPLADDWEKARPEYVALMPLWWTEERIEGMTVQAMHNGKELALRFQWIDPTQDSRAVRHNEFRDAVAIQFSLTSDPPFYMGDPGKHGGVNIWMWKADRQKDLADGYQDVEDAFPARAVDMYPEQTYTTPADAIGKEWPLGEITDHRKTFISSWGAGNLVANPQLKTPVESLVARGPGTLSGKPANLQLVSGEATYARGIWYVQLFREMNLSGNAGNGNNERTFRRGDYLPVSFAIWNGSAGDRDGKKNISIWQKLVIE